MKWSAQVWVKWNPQKMQNWKNWDWAKEWPEVRTAWSTMGEWDMAMWVESESPEKLEEFVCNKLRKQEWVLDTKSTWWNPVWQKSA